MKRLCVFIVLISCILNGCSQNNSIEMYYNLATEAIGDNENIGFDYFKELEIDKENVQFAYHVDICNRKENFFYVRFDSTKLSCTKICPDKVLMVDKQNCELTCYMKSDTNNMYYYAVSELDSKLLEYMPFYFLGLPVDEWEDYLPSMEIDKDTLINGKRVLDFTFQRHFLRQNDSTGLCDIPIIHECHNWICTEPSQLDSVVVFEIEGDKRSHHFSYHLKSLSFRDRSTYLDSVFDFDNPQYKNYSRHTESFLPYSRRGTWKSEIDSSLLDFPIVNLHNDTTSINKLDGFLLLNFWGFGCQPCYENLLKYKQQKDSLGYRILENNGIKIMAINYLSNNNELIAKIGKKTETTDIMYSAKGMREFINIPYIGYYYLFSPDKHVIYETDNLGDYSELLKAKADYEKQHQKEQK